VRKYNEAGVKYFQKLNLQLAALAAVAAWLAVYNQWPPVSSAEAWLKLCREICGENG